MTNSLRKTGRWSLAFVTSDLRLADLWSSLMRFALLYPSCSMLKDGWEGGMGTVGWTHPQHRRIVGVGRMGRAKRNPSLLTSAGLLRGHALMLLSVEAGLGQLKNVIIHLNLAPAQVVHVIIDLGVVLARAYKDRIGEFSKVVRDQRVFHTSFRDLSEQNPLDGFGCFRISVHDTLLFPASLPSR